MESSSIPRQKSGVRCSQISLNFIFMSQYFFPTHGVSIEAESQEEAVKKLQEASDNTSTSSTTPK